MAFSHCLLSLLPIMLFSLQTSSLDRTILNTAILGNLSASTVISLTHLVSV